MSELMQLLIGISINRYLPANGTAGFALIFVNGYKRDPFPPPRMMASTLFMKALLIGYSEQTYWIECSLIQKKVICSKKFKSK